MSSDKTPDLVRRAAARLGSAQANMPAAPAEPAPPAAPPPPAASRTAAAFAAASVAPGPIAAPPPPPAPSRTAAAFASASAASVDVLPEREPVRQEVPRVEVPPRTPQTRTVNVSPTSLAANGISLPSAGFVRTVEEFRVIKRQVLTTASRSATTGHNDYSRVIMVTSAKPGDGKTYTAINLALSIAYEKDLKVLLVDADVYRQSMLSYLGITADIGWIDLLADRKLTFSDILLHTNIPNLSVLPAGHSHPEVPELLSSRRMGAMVAEMARRYPDRFIIFDTLPCLASSEPGILAGLVGQTLFVVAAHETSRDQVESSLRLINGCPNVSLILNKAEPMMTDQFGAYGYNYNYQK
jgi:protein-tyrosine kinase